MIAKIRIFIREHSPELLLLVAAILFMTLRLGHLALAGSEGRWGEISRNMLQYNDWFHPVINGEIYFDKPLLSYWFINVLALLFGSLNEFIIRLPSAIAAIIAIVCTYDLGKRLWNRQIGLTAGWIMLGCYGFLFWGRTAAADMANLTAAILAVAWFFARKDKPGFLLYFVIYLICFLGALTKGLPAIAVPAAALAPYLLQKKRFLKYIQISNFVALFIGLGIYLLTFHLAATLSLPEGCSYPGPQLSGLELVWRENVLRAFNPFDHDKEGFYVYTYHLPRLMAPWAAVFIAALVGVVMEWKKRCDENTKWLVMGMALIFLMFTASGSRRWYYILPIMPFCALLTAIFINDCKAVKWKEIVMQVMYYVTLTAGIILLAGVVTLPFASSCANALLSHFMKKTIELNLPTDLLIALPLSGFFAVTAIFLTRRFPAKTEKLTGIAAKTAPTVLAVAILTGLFFALFMPSLEAFRTEKNFALEFKNKFSHIEPENIVCFIKAPTDTLFYVRPQKPWKVVDNVEELHKFLNERKGKTVLVISFSRSNYLEQLLPELPKGLKPCLREEKLSFERKKARKIYVWQLENRLK